MKRKLVCLIVLLITAFAITQPPPTVAAPPVSGNDCNVVGQVCRDISNMIYDMCVTAGNNASNCAWQEALNTMNCITANGCPLHD